METNNDNKQNTRYESVIDIKDIFMKLWRQKVMIISITLIITIISGLYSVFVLSPVYDSKLNILINMPDTYTTRYGDYTLPITTNQQYINLITGNNTLLNALKDMGSDADDLTVEDLRESIVVSEVGQVIGGVGIEQNSFIVKVSSDNSQMAKKLAETLYNNYIELLDVMLTEGAVNFYNNNYTDQIKALEDELATNNELLNKNEELLSKTVQTINQQDAMNEIQGSIKDFVVLENIINPNYTELENDIIAIKQTIIEKEALIKQYKSYLEDLNKEKVEIEHYYTTGEYNETKSNSIINTNAYIVLSSTPIAPTRKTSPSNTNNVILGAFAGGMLAILTAFIKEYFFKKDKM
jgi:capsular polysaccharide biosynthesis protein